MTPIKQVVYLPIKEETEIGYFFTPEQLNQFISNVIKDTLDTAAKEADSFVDVDESTHIEGNVWCNIDKESITSTFDITYKKHKI